MVFDNVNKMLHDEAGYYLAQTIGTERRLGDVGHYNENGFNRRSTLNNLGIQFDTRESGQQADYEFGGDRGVTQSVSAKGEPASAFNSITEAEAGVRFDFSSESSFAISINGAKEISISNKNAIAKALGEIETEYPDLNNAIVSRVMTAESTTVLISGSSEATVELRANASIEVTDFTVGDLNTNFEVSYSKNMETKQVGEQGVTPLYDLTTLEEDADLGRLPSIFSLALPSITHYVEPSPELGATASGGQPTQNDAEELLRSVRPDELTSVKARN